MALEPPPPTDPPDQAPAVDPGPAPGPEPRAARPTDRNSTDPNSTDVQPAVEPEPGPPMDLVQVRDLTAITRQLASGTTTREHLDDATLEELARALEDNRRALDAATARINGEMDARASTDRRHGHSTKAWTATTLYLPPQEAGRRIKAAKLLRQCTTLDAALRSGQISIEHVRSIAKATNPRNLEVVVELQQHLIDLTGKHLRFASWEAEVIDLLRLADADGPEPKVEDNELHVNEQFDGSAKLDATLVGETRHVVEHALDVFSNRLFDQLWSDHQLSPEDLPMPSQSTIRALALEEICRTALADTHKGPGTAADVTYVIHSDDPNTVWTSDGERVDSHTAHVAVCDAAFHAVVLDRFGNPIDVGREQRFANRQQRRAALARDGGCVYPGCCTPANRTDLHHVNPWSRPGSADHGEAHDHAGCADGCRHGAGDSDSRPDGAEGGRTDMVNLASLCRRHHGVVHRTGWSMRTVANQWFEITTPSGDVLMSQRHGRPMPAAA